MLNRALLEETVRPFGVEIDDGAFHRLDTYAELLVETNKQINLTAITEPDEVTVKHFADCLALFGVVQFPENASVIDVGTGAGFPGLVLKLYRPDLQVTFLDSTKKKLGFIEAVLSAVSLSGETVHLRAEEAGRTPKYRQKFDFATARAVSDLRNLAEYCLPLVRVNGLFLAMKSAAAEEEITAAKSALALMGGKIEENRVFKLVENTDRRVVLVRKISQTPPKYPRPSAKIAKNPLK